jgi:hypothetical protein
MWSMGRRLALGVIPLVLALAGRAGADETPPEARALFEEARGLMADGDFTTASKRLEEALARHNGRGIKYQLAVCYEKIGRIASARTLFLQVANEAHQAQEPDRESVARTHADLLEARVPHLRIVVAEPSSDMTVQRDRAIVPKSAWGASLAIDPGEHTLRADAPGHVSWEGTVTLVEGRDDEIRIPELATLPGAVVSIPDPRPASKASGPWRTPMLALGIGGLAVLGAGFGVVGASAATYGSAAQWCNGDRCTARGVGLRGDALTYGDVATGLIVAGAVVVVGAAIVWLWNPRSAPPRVAIAF